MEHSILLPNPKTIAILESCVLASARNIISLITKRYLAGSLTVATTWNLVKNAKY